MKIDIDRLTETELVDLNRRVVERLRLLQQMQAHVHMLEFKVGERVQFQPAGHPPVTGVLTRYNRKTVTVIADTGQQWNVAPQLLQQVDLPASAGDQKPNVIPMPRRPGKSFRRGGTGPARAPYGEPQGSTPMTTFESPECPFL